jgi:hypothetical protein
MKALLVALACALTVSAQKQPAKPCLLTLEQSPEIRGLKLGQTPSDVDKVLRREPHVLSLKADEIGERQESLTRYSLQDRELLKGISILGLNYLDDQLSVIRVFYDSSVRWESNLHFTSAIADSLHLPTDGWSKSEVGVRLACTGFSVETYLSQWLIIRRSGYSEEVARRKAAIEQKKRVEFKP